MREELKARLGRQRVDQAKRLAARAFAHDLDRLARFFGTDKSTRAHGFTPFYQLHLEDRRKQVKSVLEIGVRYGASLRMWAHYFPHAQLYGIDRALDPAFSEPRVTLFEGDQTDRRVLEQAIRAGARFDVIVDDGSHIAGHAEASFRCLFEHLRPGGLYVIEDLATAYHPEYGGGSSGAPGTTLAFIRDELLDCSQGRGAFPVAAVHLYDELVFVERGETSSARS
jgi:SAM-dependent methyltransferase